MGNWKVKFVCINEEELKSLRDKSDLVKAYQYSIHRCPERNEIGYIISEDKSKITYYFYKTLPKKYQESIRLSQ